MDDVIDLIVDRWEEAWAVVELPDRSTISIPRSWLPPGVREGDGLRMTRQRVDDRSVIWQLTRRGGADPSDLDTRRARLGRRDPGGDIDL